MQVAVIGMGNVGTALLHSLANNSRLEQILVMSRRKEAATAAIMDVASAHPHGAAKMVFAPYDKISSADIIVITAGVQMLSGQSAKDVLEPNAKITEEILQTGSIKLSTIVICLATPVDYVTVHVQKRTKLPYQQVFGFGGDLDRNRLEYVLRSNGIEPNGAKIIGEHGANAIPVYAGEANYSAVATDVRRFLSTITKLAGETRNLATASLLAKLVDSIACDSKAVHYVCGYHPEHQVYLTWPFVIGRTGILQAEQVEIETHTSRDLKTLVHSRIHQCENSG